MTNKKLWKKTPHQRIVAAKNAGTGCLLSRQEILSLCMDDAITTCAENDDIAEDRFNEGLPFDELYD